MTEIDIFARYQTQISNEVIDNIQSKWPSSCIILVHIVEKFGIGEKCAPYLGEYFKVSCRCRANNKGPTYCSTGTLEFIEKYQSQTRREIPLFQEFQSQKTQNLFSMTSHVFMHPQEPQQIQKLYMDRQTPNIHLDTSRLM